MVERLASRFDDPADLRDHVVALPDYGRPSTFQRRRATPVTAEMMAWVSSFDSGLERLSGGRFFNAQELVEAWLGTGLADTSTHRVKIVQSKSMPRSGHHFLVLLLEEYFGTDFGYCEFYKPIHCCKLIPCARPTRPGAGHRYFMQKSHDFFFEDPVDHDQSYLIEYRQLIPRSQSNFEYALKAGSRRDTFEEFWAFVDASIEYQISFIRKWIETPPPASVLLDYAILSTSPEKELTRVVEFITGTSADIERVRACVDRVRPTNAHTNRPFRPRRVEQHRYFDADRAKDAEMRIKQACPGLESAQHGRRWLEV
jgi:hypothetical protein